MPIEPYNQNKQQNMKRKENCGLMPLTGKKAQDQEEGEDGGVCSISGL